MPEVLNKYKLDGKSGVYIGRPSKWGNPFTIGKDGTREEVVEKYRHHIENNQQLKCDVIRELKGKNLICFCSPKLCHGHILLRIANENYYW